MEDKKDDLSNLPDNLRNKLEDHRRAREAGLRELVHRQNAAFLDEVEAEMWNLLSLPGQTQPGLIVAIVGAILSKEVRKQARTNILEANRLAIADYKQRTDIQEMNIRQVYRMSDQVKSTDQ